jgi:hypothetical protein
MSAMSASAPSASITPHRTSGGARRDGYQVDAFARSGRGGSVCVDDLWDGLRVGVGWGERGRADDILAWAWLFDVGDAPRRRSSRDWSHDSNMLARDGAGDDDSTRRFRGIVAVHFCFHCDVSAG